MEINRIEIKELAKAIMEEMDLLYSAELAPKWERGSIFFIPEDSTQKDHEIPIEKIMHKIVMMRDNLRVLEAQINSCEKLSDGEKVKFQGYISRCYGSMTSFNFLFRNPEDRFISK
jgi:hypothetical protein